MPHKNKEDQKAWQKNWYQANKKEIAAKDKARYESKRDGLYTVYLLTKEGYVGMTSHLNSRIQNHRKDGRDISDVQIIGKYHTKDEALRIEARYHNEGFKGAWGFKQRMEEFNKPEAVARRKEIENYLRQVGIDFNLI